LLSKPFTPSYFGKYYLVEKIASGGMAEVFRAVLKGAAGFEKTVALKRILPFFGDDAAFVTLFQDEARIVSTLSHGNIAHVFDFGEVDGSYYLTMELVDGSDLAKLGDKMAEAGQPMPTATAAFVVAEAARGLAYAHEKKDAEGNTLGIVHRDVSPQNILVSYDGEVKVTDFGIAKAAGKAHKTATGVVMGKLKYMSPEQVSGKALDPRSDIFSLGVILYELVTGGPVFPGEETVRLAELIHTADIPPPSARTPGLPPALDAIALKALRRSPDERYARAAELARDLSLFVNQHSPGFTRDDLAAMVRHIAPPPARTSTGSVAAVALAPTEVTPPTGGAAPTTRHKKLDSELMEIPPTRRTPPPGDEAVVRAAAPAEPRQLDLPTRTRLPDEAERKLTTEPVPRRKRLSREAWIGIVLAAVTLAAGAMIVLRFVLPAGDDEAAGGDASLVSSRFDAGAFVETPVTDAAVAGGISEERKQEIARRLQSISAIKQPGSAAFQTFLSGLDWEVARLVVDDKGAVVRSREPMAPALADRVQKAGLGEAVELTAEYFGGTGQLPSQVSFTLEAFLARNPPFSRSAEWTVAALLVAWKGAEPERVEALARANQALGRWCAPLAAPRRRRDPTLCEPAPLAAALRNAGEKGLADALERWQTAIPNDKRLELGGGTAKITSISYSPLIVNLDATVSLEGKLLAGDKTLSMRREQSDPDAGPTTTRLTADAPDDLFAPVLELKSGADSKLVRL
jgi:serine/threonine protein kinase